MIQDLHTALELFSNSATAKNKHVIKGEYNLLPLITIPSN